MWTASVSSNFPVSSHPAGGWPWAGTTGLIRETGHPVHQEPQSGLQRLMSSISLPGWPAPSSTFFAGFAMLLFCTSGLYLSTIPKTGETWPPQNCCLPNPVEKRTRSTPSLKVKHWFASSQIIHIIMSAPPTPSSPIFSQNKMLILSPVL